jgi:hypothetical protein
VRDGEPRGSGTDARSRAPRVAPGDVNGLHVAVRAFDSHGSVAVVVVDNRPRTTDQSEPGQARCGLSEHAEISAGAADN